MKSMLLIKSMNTIDFIPQLRNLGQREYIVEGGNGTAVEVHDRRAEEGKTVVIGSRLEVGLDVILDGKVEQYIRQLYSTTA